MNTRRGFTLIEMLIVVSILGLVAGIAMPRVQEARARARAAEVVSNMRTIRLAAFHYYDSAETWPGPRGAGVVPPELEGYLPSAVEFAGVGYDMTWQRVRIGRRRRMEFEVRLQVRTTDPLLCDPLGKLLGGPSSSLAVSCGRSGGRVTETIER